MDRNQEVDRLRRDMLTLGALLGAVPLSACGGGGAAVPTGGGGTPPLPAPGPGPAPSPAPPPVPPAPAGAYRPGQTYLFQSIAAPTYPSALGGSSYNADVWAPTYNWVDFSAGWPWANPGGDWLDANLGAQGTSAWASFAANAVSGQTAVFDYTGIDITELVAYCQANDRPCAFIVRQTGPGPRQVASLSSNLGRVPRIEVAYGDGSVATLSCRLLSANTRSSSVPGSTGDRIGIPFFIEFDRPSKPVTSAITNLTVTAHWDGLATIQYFLCNPAVNSQPVTGVAALASQAGALDAGIAAVDGVIGAQRYVDGATLNDFVVVGNGNHTAEMFYDPALWGGASKLDRWPHTVVGKWINTPDPNYGDLKLVDSSYSGEGFEPLAPGLGALRITMVDGGIQTGQEGGYSGTGPANMKLFMPYADMGLLRTVFVRYYLRLGSPQNLSPGDRREVLQSGAPKWTDMGGKFGISASHTTTYGGTSGSSGGGYGWQMRHSWQECEAARGGPDEGGLLPGWHLYDFQSSNPPSYRYGGEPQNRNNWGQIGGLGAVLYAGRWYCIECEITLNSVDPRDDSFTPDGVLRTWIDGRLAFERTGMVFRTLPIYQPAYNGNYIRPMRELGIKELWWNWYHGGTTQSSVARTQFVTGLVWARSRIGLMK